VGCLFLACPLIRVNKQFDLFVGFAIILDMTRNRTTELLSVLHYYGGVNSMARAFGLCRQAISKWDRVPLKHLSRIVKETGIPRLILRPDLYEDD
jgi:hypothetical protein